MVIDTEIDCMDLKAKLKEAGVTVPEDCYYDIYYENGKWTIYQDRHCHTVEDDKKVEAHDFHQYLKEDHFLEELKLAVKEAKTYLKYNNIEINMPERKQGKKDLSKEAWIPACTLTWTYNLNMKDRKMKA